MKASTFVLVVAVLTVGWFTLPATAHDGSFALSFDDWANQTVLHDPELYPFKGLATVTVTNSSLSNYWTDFHFEIASADIDANSILFTTEQPIVSTQNPFTYNIGTNDLGRSTLDLYFDDDPVAPGEAATFIVYTDNTSVENTWFGICMWPTPEPSSLLLLGLGGLFLARRRG